MVVKVVCPTEMTRGPYGHAMCSPCAFFNHWAPSRGNMQRFCPLTSLLYSAAADSTDGQQDVNQTK